MNFELTKNGMEPLYGGHFGTSHFFAVIRGFSLLEVKNGIGDTCWD